MIFYTQLELAKCCVHLIVATFRTHFEQSIKTSSKYLFYYFCLFFLLFFVFIVDFALHSLRPNPTRCSSAANHGSFLQSAKKQFGLPVTSPAPLTPPAVPASVAAAAFATLQQPLFLCVVVCRTEETQTRRFVLLLIPRWLWHFNFITTAAAAVCNNNSNNHNNEPNNSDNNRVREYKAPA